MIFNFFLFDRAGTCLFHREWKRLSTAARHDFDQDSKLMFGMLYSIKAFVNRISPKPPTIGFQYYKTSSYKINYLETLTGLKFVLTTDLNVGDITDELREIYSQIYVETVIKNPAYRLGAPIDSELFAEQLDRYIRGLGFFRY